MDLNRGDEIPARPIRLRFGLAALLLAAIFVLVAMTLYQGVGQVKNSKQAERSSFRIWPSDPPKDCPFPKSTVITGIALTGRYKDYDDPGHIPAGADTWFPTWASNGNLYSPYADGWVGNVRVGGMGPKSTEGAAKIIGDDPMDLRVVPRSPYRVSSPPDEGRYPSASLVYNGIWYYGTYMVQVLEDKEYNCWWCVVGPFVGFGVSRDYGRTWEDTKLTPANNLFQETTKNGRRVKMGMTRFVDLGKNMEYSPDGYAYLVADGALTPGTPAGQALLNAPTWGKYNHALFKGDMFYLARTKPSPETINEESAWEFYGGKDAHDKDVWTKNFAAIKPLFEWAGHCGGVQVTYDAPLKKYLWFVNDPLEGTGGFMPGEYPVPYNTYVLESDRLTGPWKLVTYLRMFGEEAYWVNIPSKFISADGRTAWLVYSANWAGKRIPEDPLGSKYALCLHEIRLLSQDSDVVSSGGKGQ